MKLAVRLADMLTKTANAAVVHSTNPQEPGFTHTRISLVTSIFRDTGPPRKSTYVGGEKVGARGGGEGGEGGKDKGRDASGARIGKKEG